MKTEKIEVPKDLGVKIGSPEQVFWNDLKDKLTADNLNHERQIQINIHAMALAEEKIAKEKEKFK